MKRRTRKTLLGRVDKVIKPLIPTDPEKVQITVDTPDQLYREIRIENKLRDEKGKPVKLKPDAPVDVTIEADKEHTEPD